MSLLFGAVATLSSACAQSVRHSLQLEWVLEVDSSEAIPAAIPGSVYEALLNAGLIADPFAGANADSLRWVAEREWVFKSKPFRLPDDVYNSGFDAFILQWPEIDPCAVILLNGNEIMRCDNAFVPCFEFIRNFRASDNILEVHFESPLKRAVRELDSLFYRIPGDSVRSVLRKPQYQFGWDWAPALPSVGISAAPQLLAIDGAMIYYASIQTAKADTQNARMVATAAIMSTNPGRCKLTLKDNLGNVLATKKFRAGVGEKEVIFGFQVERPELWSTHEFGKPAISHATVLLEENFKSGKWRRDSVRVSFGIRSVRLNQKRDGEGRSFEFELNGEPIFARGANYVPPDVFPARISKERQAELLTAMREANMNMVRVWGGGRYESDTFYHLCDSLGILVWQDFMFACSMYPGHPSFLKLVRREADYQTRRLAAHPSVALWCGNNEVAEGWARWGWKAGLEKSELRALNKAYRGIFRKTLPDFVGRNTRTAYIESSPMLGRGDPAYTTRGSAHNWWVWHDAAPFENYTEQVPRFMAEYGFQSFPSKATLQSYIAPEDFNVYSDAMRSHQKHQRGFELMDTYMARWNLRGRDFSKAMWLSQIVQAEGIGMGARAHRLGKPRCSGSLVWQLNDCWPAISWSIIDYQGRPKAVYYELKRAFAPVISIPEIQNDSIRFWLISDVVPEEEYRIRVVTYHFDGRLIQDTVCTVQSNSRKPIRLFVHSLDSYFGTNEVGHCYSVVEISNRTNAIHSEVFFHANPGALPPVQPQLEMDVAEGQSEFLITVSAKSAAPWVEVVADVPGKWSGNFVHVVPGHSPVLTFIPDLPGVVPRFTVNSLFEALPEKE